MPPHFRTALPPAGAGHQTAAALGTQVLTTEERAFVARLPEIRVAVALPSFRPYEVVGDDGEVSGIHAEMLVALAQAFGLRLKPVVFANWSDSLEAAKRGDVDLLMSMGLTPARAEQFEFTLGVTPMVSGVFGRQLASGAMPPPLESASFAVQASKMVNDYLLRQYPQARIVPVASQALAFEAVSKGEADYHVTDLLPALDALARKPVPGIELRQLASHGSGSYHFAVRKDWALLARILNKGLTSLRGTPSAPLAAAMAALPASAATPTAVVLTRHQQAVLWDFPSWRVGAVRGLSLLNEVDANGRHNGIGAEVVEAVARRLGVGLKILPFDSVAAMLDALRAGTIDVVPLLTHTPGRAREFTYSRPYVEMPYMIVARNDAPLFWDLNSLRGKRLALAQQHPLRELLAQRYPDIRIVNVGGGQAAMDAVARGDADAAVEVKYFANLRIQGDNDGQLRTVAAVAELPGGFHFATSQRAQALVPLIDDSLAAIDPAERLRMQRRWIAPDQAPSLAWRRHLPLIAASLAALLALAALMLWWLQRLRREVRARRLAQMQLSDIEAALPCVAFRTRFDAQGTLLETHFSAGASALLGFEPDPRRTLIQNIGPHLVADDLSALQAAQQHSVQQGERMRVGGRYAHPDGRSLWLRSEVLTRREADGGTILTGYVADVSREHDLHQQLLQEAENRHLMLASASHELRAPTHTVSLALQSLSSQGVPSRYTQPLREAREATEQLARHLDALLDTARQDRSRAGQGQHMPGAVAVPVSPPTTPIQRGPVLLCDDDEVSRVLLAHLLERHGFVVEQVGDGAAALARWQAGGVGALVTDMNMAGMAGGQLIDAIRTAERRQLPQATASLPNRTPIVVCSGSPLPAEVLAQVARQHDAYLLKPVDIDQLVHTLRELGLQTEPAP